MKLSKRECEHLLDALQEYEDIVIPKELEDNEVGMNAERLDKCKQRLMNFITTGNEYGDNENE
jgi:hypothetical protein|tara:strand:- start:267 stop:455 length:189 start_codon:yes stop_codon:yes gene_type:complete